VTAPAAWTCTGVSVRYPGATRRALADLTLTIGAGLCTAVLGPNGSGKSTLFRVLLGACAPETGTVTCFGRPLSAWPRAELARTIGVVSQSEVETFPMTVRELVAMGRYPHLGPWKRERPGDVAAIDAAIARCDVARFADRWIGQLSAGERQRVRMARALAQVPQVLALDEPTASLDLAHEMAILQLVRALADSAVSVLLITHNLGLAGRYADRVLLLRDGYLVAEGSPIDVLTPDIVESVFGWPVTWASTSGGDLHLVPLDADRQAADEALRA
jgi:iron complex transport system ATP-binding protein